MSKKITEKVTWVGKIDWELTHFHGDELSTHRGSSYNSYLIKDEKTVLIDTVWGPYDREFVARLKEEVDLKTIDAIIMQHNESDHSGALPELMREIPDVPIYCTAKGKAIIQGHYHQDWNFVTVKTGDTLSIGENTLTFIEATMLHWPDTMFTYMSGENILFSNDAFGQHFASESLYDDRVDKSEMLYEAKKYYANILAPFNIMVTRKLKEVLAMNLPLNLVCPSHGVIWRKDINLIIDLYQKWAANYQEHKVSIVYDTMWNSTRIMAQEIARGILEVDPTLEVKLFNAAHEDKNDVLTEMFASKAILVGSPTINNGLAHSIAGLLEMAKGLKLKGKKAAAFGSYGWSGEGVKLLNALLTGCGFELINEGHRTLWVPNQAAIEACRDYGREIAKAL